MNLTFSITRKLVATWTVLTLISLFAQALEPIDQETQPEQASENPRQEKTTKEKRGSLIVAPIPISSPAIGSGVVLAGGYIFTPRKSDKVSQPSTMAGAVLITDNGSRAWGLGGEFYLKQDTYHITTIYFRGNINYDFYGTGTASGDVGQKLPLKQTGELFLGDFLYRLRWKLSIGPRFLTGNSNITQRSENVNGVAVPPDVGIQTRLTAVGFHANRDTRPNRLYPEKGTFTEVGGVTVRIGSNGGIDIPAVRTYREHPSHAAAIADILFRKQHERDEDDPARARGFETGHLSPRVNFAGRCEEKACRPNSQTTARGN